MTYTNREIIQMAKAADLALVQQLARELRATRAAKSRANRRYHQTWSEADYAVVREASEAHINRQVAYEMVRDAYRAKTA